MAFTRSGAPKIAAGILGGFALVLGTLAPGVAASHDPEEVDPLSAIEDVADQVESAATERIDSGVEYAPVAGELIAGTDGTVAIDQEADPSLTLRGIDSEVRIDNALPGELTDSSSGQPYFEADDYTVVPVAHEDGSVQITTVLQNADAPSSYTYSSSSNGGTAIELFEDDSAIVWDEEGKYVAAIAPPWAYDANGVAVETWYTVDGSALIQHVAHDPAVHAYPIAADPWAGINLFDWVTRDTYRSQPRVNAQPSWWGYSNVATVAGQAIMRTAGWDEVVARSGGANSPMRGKESMRQQFDCHALGSYFAGTWNLERVRPTLTVSWLNNVHNHRCNWTTATAGTTGGW